MCNTHSRDFIVSVAWLPYSPARRRLTLICLLPLIVALGVSAEGFDWPQWRGPDGNGISYETGWNPDAIEGSPWLAWQASIGIGYSSVSVADGRVFALGNEGNRDTVYCFEMESGEQLWSHSYSCAKGQYPGPRATPTIEGDRVYTLSREGHLFCFAAATGRVIWQIHLNDDFRIRSPGWGFASSPVVYGDLLILNTGSAGMAVDKLTGRLVWDSGRSGGGYSSAVVTKVGNEEILVILSNKELSGVNPESGKVLWRLGWGTVPDVNGADPVVSGTKVFIAAGYGKGSALVDFSGTPKIEWRSRLFDTHFSSFVLIDGYLYGNDGDARRTSSGTFRCVEFDSGDEQWAAREGFGSLIAVDDYFIMLDSTGEIIVADVDPSEFSVVARGSLPRNQYWTPPVFSHGLLYIRNLRGDLYCVDMR